MQVINATKGNRKRMISVMLDRGQQLQIAPGEVSIVFTPSVNTIKALINSGTSDEIGIIFGGSWEESIGNQVTGGFPYYYTNLNEAKSKLFTDDINETPTQSVPSEVNTDNSEVIANLQLKVDERDKKIADLESQKAKWELDNTKLQNADQEITDLKAQLKQVQSELDGTKSNLDQYKSKCSELEHSFNQASEKNKAFNTQNEELIKKIEDMRATFNSVCDQFNIHFDETKGWFIP